MAKAKHRPTASEPPKLPLETAAIGVVPPLWELNIREVTGHNIEAAGREEVNRLLSEGWILLHVYTLKYREDGTWRERPMAILGLPHRTSSKPSKARL